TRFRPKNPAFNPIGDPFGAHVLQHWPVSFDPHTSLHAAHQFRPSLASGPIGSAQFAPPFGLLLPVRPSYMKLKVLK
uniref:Uncharacterized protein n=1 Tax=Cucumis melo TaxID=3656 RepID=A0A9I9DY33_CUCME